MKNIGFLPLLILFTTALAAQSAAPAEQSDPQAKKVLDRVRKKYEGYKTVEVAFTLASEVPGQPKDTQKGTVGQQGAKFRLDMPQQIIASDGKTTWVYLKQTNEIQINDADPGSDNAFFTPLDLLRRYEKGDFLFAITDKTTEKGRVLTQIEFKPKDKSSEYSKLRISIDEKNGAIDGIRAFFKDGSRYQFQITRTTPNKSFAADYFQLNPKNFPGAHVEDLRM